MLSSSTFTQSHYACLPFSGGSRLSTDRNPAVLLHWWGPWRALPCWWWVCSIEFHYFHVYFLLKISCFLLYLFQTLLKVLLRAPTLDLRRFVVLGKFMATSCMKVFSACADNCLDFQQILCCRERKASFNSREAKDCEHQFQVRHFIFLIYLLHHDHYSVSMPS